MTNTMKPLRLIAGPCVIESRDKSLFIAEHLVNTCHSLDIDLVFKASYDKANRTSSSSFRGPGLQEGLSILSEIRDLFGIKVLTDIHESHEAAAVAQAVDVLQIPAFLCRQTPLISAASSAALANNSVVNVKKGQFSAPNDMKNVVAKFCNYGLSPSTGRLWLTERGSTFGYNNLVVDFRSLPQLRTTGCPVIFDATHSVQQPGANGETSSGQREFVAPLARAAVAVGVDGLFLEVHPDPENALSDGPNMVPLHRLEPFLSHLLLIRSVVSVDLPVTSI